MKQSKQSVAPIVDAGPELEPVTAEYLESRPQSDIDHIEWLWLLWGHRRAWARVAVWGLLASILIALVVPNRYESTTRIMPPDQAGSGLAMVAAMAAKGGGLASSGLGAMAGDLLGLKSSGALFLEIVHSRTVQDRLIDRFDLRKVYRDRYWQDARKDLSKHTDALEDRKSGVITITVTDKDPRRAAQLAQAYVEELDRLVAQVSTSSARRERVFIEQRLLTVKEDLDAASRQFSEYASKNTALDIGAQGKATVEAAARVEGELIASQSQLEGLEQIYTKNNVRVRSLQARVDELRNQLHKIGGDTSVSPSGQTTQEFPSFRQLPLLGVRWADLYRQTKIEETVYELLTQQYELAKIQEAKEIPTVKVLDAPSLPEKKSFPPRLVMVLFGTMLSLAGGVAWIVGSEVWKRADPRDARKLLLQEIVGDMKAHMSWISRNHSGFGAKPKVLKDQRVEDDGQNGNVR